MSKTWQGNDEAADYLGYSPSYLNKSRQKILPPGVKRGPKFSKRAGKVIYKTEWLDEWLEEGVVEFDEGVNEKAPQARTD